ncbi:PepSY-associated TM helix domain-containing protein [Rhodopseudomonas palustris]|uniref:PepSY domain-containing protein n=1 Tax=Rhodopseudomonas palustris TaxID=1076 RepID=A0A418VM37_RHOPL|nr:PepSY-associated TM helix domain-containing protein [Rhodopseudomonas palustris]RJF77177.1 PepSY domain-containing protein [Rhodopseudomonas palustris]
MNNVLLLKLHRWITLVFALPLIVLILTGLILSAEPIIQSRGLPAGLVDADRLTALLQRYDPAGQARGLSINASGQQMRLLGVTAPAIDLVSGEPAATSDRLGDVMLWARRTHEHLLGYDWLVIGSTIAMVVIMGIGIVMGLPRLRNSLAGWHKGAAWLTLPLLLLSPITGLFMAFGWTLTGAPPSPLRPPLPLTEAVRSLAQTHDVSHLAMLAQRGQRMMARIYEDGELRAYTFTAGGVTPMPRNWPRLLHEGNWSALIAGTLNLIVSVVLAGLLSTGLLLWARRKLRQHPKRASIAPSARPSSPTSP